MLAYQVLLYKAKFIDEELSWQADEEVDQSQPPFLLL